MSVGRLATNCPVRACVGCSSDEEVSASEFKGSASEAVFCSGRLYRRADLGVASGPCVRGLFCSVLRLCFVLKER